MGNVIAQGRWRRTLFSLFILRKEKKKMLSIPESSLCRMWNEPRSHTRCRFLKHGVEMVVDRVSILTAPPCLDLSWKGECGRISKENGRRGRKRKRKRDVRNAFHVIYLGICKCTFLICVTHEVLCTSMYKTERETGRERNFYVFRPRCESVCLYVLLLQSRWWRRYGGCLPWMGWFVFWFFFLPFCFLSFVFFFGRAA